MGAAGESARRRIEWVPVPFLLVAGLILTLSLIIRIPFGDSLIIPGQVAIGPAVVTIGDLYLVFLAAGLIMYHRQIWIPRSPTTLALTGFAVAILISAVMNGLDASALLEVIQWTEMGVLAVIVGVLLRQDWERRLALRVLVYIGSLRAVWTLAYFLLNGYPGRRFDILIEGAALVVLLGLIAHEGWTRIDLLQLGVLVPTVLIGQERKVWIAIAGATVVMAIAYAVRTRDGYVIGLTLVKGSIATAALATVGFIFILPPDIQERIFTLIAIIPGIGGQSEFERLYIISTGVEMFVHNPLFGVGPENWFEAKQMYATDNLVAFEERTDSNLGPHSIFLKMLAEMGLIGLTSSFLLLVRPLRFLGWYLKESDTSTLYFPLLGLFLFALAVAAFRSGGFVMRAYLFLPIGFLLSYELNGLNYGLATVVAHKRTDVES